MLSLRKPAAQWVADNPVLLSTQLGQEIDTLRVKRGNSTDPWNSLPYDNTITVDLNGRITATPLLRANAAASMSGLTGWTVANTAALPELPTPTADGYPSTALYPSTTLYPNI